MGLLSPSIVDSVQNDQDEMGSSSIDSMGRYDSTTSNVYISSIEFDHTSKYIAIGHSNGLIAIYKSSILVSNNSSSSNITNIGSSSGSISSSSHHQDTQCDEMFEMEDDYSYISDAMNKRMSVDQLPIKKIRIDSLGSSSSSLSSSTNNIAMSATTTSIYELLFCFQGHETEVIQMKWCKGVCSTILLLSTSVSSTKLWRFNDRSLSSGVSGSSGYNNPFDSSMPFNQCPKKRNQGELRVEQHQMLNDQLIELNDTIIKLRFTLKKTYEYEEIFNINSISLNSDGQTFLSSDEFRVFLWDLNANQQCFNIINLKPSNIQLLNEIIRVTEFHPIQCNYLVYGTSRGSVKLCDMRVSALCNDFSKSYSQKQSTQTIFSDYLNTILDLRFSPDGRYFVTRNFDFLSIWDINNDSQPMATYNLYNQDSLRAKLYDMYESAAFVDKLPCCFINQNEIITGSYDNKCLVWNPFTSNSFSFECTDPFYSNNSSSQISNSFDNTVTIPSDFNYQFYTSTTLSQQQQQQHTTNNLFNNIHSPPMYQPFQQQQQQQQQPFNYLERLFNNNNIIVQNWNQYSNGYNNVFSYSPSLTSVNSNNITNDVVMSNDNPFTQQQQQTTTTATPSSSSPSPSTSSSPFSTPKLTIKGNVNSINCISSSNNSIAISNKSKLYIYR